MIGRIAGPRIADRYLLREFVASQLAALGILVSVVVIVDLWERIDTYLDHHATALEVARFHAASVPYTVMVSLPISILLGVIFSLGRFARRNEIVALQSAGVSLTRFLRPLFLLALLSSGLSLAFNELAVPRANRWRERVYDVEIQGQSPRAPGRIPQVSYLGAGGRLFQMREYDAPEQAMRDAMLLQFDGVRLASRVDAREVRWTGGSWLFLHGYRRVFPPDGGETVVSFDSLRVPGIAERPEDFRKEEDDPDLMSMSELRRFAARTRASGADPRRYLVEVGSRTAIPFANFIVVLLGAPLAALHSRGGAARGFGLGLGVAFLYYGTLRLSQTLANHTGLSPYVGPWLANGVFALAGLYLLQRVARR